MNTKEEAKKWIEEGRPCKYQCGFTWKGARSRPIDKEEALKLLPKYDFGMGFWELRFDGSSLIFNEFTESDMF